MVSIEQAKTRPSRSLARLAKSIVPEGLVKVFERISQRPVGLVITFR
jgi:hypothetical protein